MRLHHLLHQIHQKSRFLTNPDKIANVPQSPQNRHLRHAMKQVGNHSLLSTPEC